MSHSAKRPHDGPHDRRERPRDWRDAHLSERDSRDPRDRRDNRDRDRDYYSRDRDYERRDRDRDDGRWRHDRGGNYERERERGFPSRSSDRNHRNDSHNGREEGEIESPPRASSSHQRSPRATHDRSRSPRLNSPRGVSGAFKSPRGESGAFRSPRGEHGRIAPSPKKVSIALPDGSRSAPARDPLPEPELDEAVDEPEDEEKKIEERRRKRLALMAKLRDAPKSVASSSGAPSPARDDLVPGSGADSVVSAGFQTGANTESGATPLLKMLGTRSINTAFGANAGTGTFTPHHEPSLSNTPMGKHFDLKKHGEAGPSKGGVSAAEYTEDGTGTDRQKRMEAVVPEGDDVKINTMPATGESKLAGEDEWEEVEIEVEEEEDDVDMFAAFGEDEPVKKMRKVTVRRRKAANGEIVETIHPASNVKAALDVVDNVDDTDGYYRITPGEILDDGRYQVTVTLGKGMFSAVVKATVLKAVGQERHHDVVGKEVAIKLMRSQESMYVAGRKEAQILKLLNDADPEDKKHIVRMERTFEHKGHLAIVTESLSMNLRDVIKRFGKDVGLNMRAVRAYAHQMLLALSLMRKVNIVHADIKPDNVLVSENKAVLKVCDLGTAAEVSQGEITPYLVSRFYRAPEIILGLPYDFAIDIWAIGCTLFELYTGKILFPGRSNNHMLLLQQETKGKLPVRLIKKATLAEQYFDEANNMISIEKDRITGADVVKTTIITKATKDIRSRIMPSSSTQAKMPEAELKQLQQFVDLLDKCLMLDPVRRISAREALLHPFVTGEMK